MLSYNLDYNLLLAYNLMLAYKLNAFLQPDESSLLSHVFSFPKFPKFNCDVLQKSHLNPFNIVLASPKIAKFLKLEW